MFSIVSHINEWFVSIRLSVSLSVWLSVSLCCMNKFLFCFLCFSFSYRFSFSSHLWFPFSSFYLMNIFLAHTCSHAHSRTLTYKWLHVSSYDFYVLLRKEVCEESYSSDCIISYLIQLDKITIIILLLWYYLDAITVHWIIIIWNESIYISSCLILSHLVLSCLDWSWLVLLF